MLNLPQKNRLTLIVLEAERVNNWIDCDVIAENSRQLDAVIDGGDRAEIREAVISLVSAIQYRGGSLKLIKQYWREFKAYESEKCAQKSGIEPAIQYFQCNRMGSGSGSK
jgi:hypothetical protein